MMSMEISNRYGLDYIHKAQTEQTAKATERAEEAAKSKEKDKPEYISSEKSGKKPSGLYHMEQDKNGNPKIIFDTAKKAEEAESEQPKGEQQLKMAAGNEQKTKELKAKLAQVEAELSVKDTAEYKKQHAEYTTEE